MILTTVQLRRASCVMDTLVPQVLIYNNVNNNNNNINNEKDKKRESCTGWQKLRGSTGDTRRKVWTRTKISSLNIRYLSRIKICCNLRTFWRSLGKNSAFLGQKQCFMGKKCTITWYVLHILLS